MGEVGDRERERGGGSGRKRVSEGREGRMRMGMWMQMQMGVCRLFGEVGIWGRVVKDRAVFRELSVVSASGSLDLAC